MQATPTAAARGRIELGLNRVPAGHGEEGDPDRWAPPVGGRRKERGAGPDWAGKRETGWRDFPGPRGEKGKGKRRDGPAGLKRGRGKGKTFPFLKGFKHIQFKFEFKNSNSN